MLEVYGWKFLGEVRFSGVEQLKVPKSVFSELNTFQSTIGSSSWDVTNVTLDVDYLQIIWFQGTHIPTNCDDHKALLLSISLYTTCPDYPTLLLYSICNDDIITNIATYYKTNILDLKYYLTGFCAHFPSVGSKYDAHLVWICDCWKKYNFHLGLWLDLIQVLLAPRMMFIWLGFVIAERRVNLILFSDKVNNNDAMETENCDTQVSIISVEAVSCRDHPFWGN